MQSVFGRKERRKGGRERGKERKEEEWEREGRREGGIKSGGEVEAKTTYKLVGEVSPDQCKVHAFGRAHAAMGWYLFQELLGYEDKDI